MPQSYVEQARGQSYTIQRELGTGRKKPSPENIHYHLGQLGHSNITLNEISVWAATCEDSRARQLYDLQGLLQIEPELARAFLKDRGLSARPDPTDHPDRAAVYAIAQELASKPVKQATFDEWADRPGYGKTFFNLLVEASKLPKVERSVAIAFLRYAKIPRKS